MIIPLIRNTTNLLRALPSYLQEDGHQTKYYLDLGRVDLPYVWFIRYVNGNNGDVLHITYGKSIKKAAFNFLCWLGEHKRDYIYF